MTGARCSIGRRKLLCALGCTYMTLAASSFGAGGRPAMFNDTTYDELTALPPEQRMIAAIQCEDVMLLSSGSRRERVLITARLLAGADNVKFEAPLRLIRYTQRDPLVKRGQAYVVVAYPGEWLPAWNLVDFKPIEESNAASAVSAAMRELSARAGGAR